jgi:hypothetical protein
LVITLLCPLNICMAQNSIDNNNEWLKSYEHHRTLFKNQSQAEIETCEIILKEILTDLDINNQCSVDSDCALIEQEPFGNTVPYPSRLSESMKAKMKKYFNQCVSSKFHSVMNEALMHEPVCRQNKCKVRTSLEK